MLQETLPSIDNLQAQTIEQLLQIYKLYARVYRYRQEYRRKGFREEFWDSGHEIMIQNFWSYLQTIEEAITKVCTSTSFSEKTDPENVAQDDILEERDIDMINVQTLKQVHKKILRVETVDRHLKCLASKYKQQAAELERVKKASLTVLNQIAVKEFGYKTEPFGYNRFKVSQIAHDLIFEHVLGMLGLVLVQLQSAASEHKTDYSDTVYNFMRICKACCLKEIVRVLIDPRIKYFLFQLAIEFIDKYYTFQGSNFKLTFGKNLYVQDNQPIDVWDKDFRRKTVLFSELKAKNYYICRVNFQKGHKNLMVTFGYYPLETEGIVQKWTTHEHKEAIETCPYCVEELKQNLDYGKLHPK
jgi:hypothetical protein